MAAAALLIIAATELWIYIYQVQKPDGSGTVSLHIEKEMTGEEIAQLLEKKHVISSAVSFRMALVLTGDSRNLQSGQYRLTAGMTVRDVIAALEKGQEDFRTVTIPEGATAAQIGIILRQAGLPCGREFADEAASYAPMPYMYGPEAATVKGEGFLFPDTYDIPMRFSAKDVCDMMYRRMDQVLTPELRKKAKEHGLSIHDVITLASMVEREAKWPEDRVPIASVMERRLAEGMPLQIDACIQYILGRQKEELTEADTKIQSPYNTYLRSGLPPGPISNPGKESIAAVLDAQPGPYLYYVADASGHHRFARTYEEHQANIEAIYGNQ